MVGHVSPSHHEALDEAFVSLGDTGPEFAGWLSNHGPMAADALIRLGRADAVPAWIHEYRARLEPTPGVRWSIDEHEWREPLGDPSRLGDWLAHFHRHVHTSDWQDLLALWWPRLMSGAIASATHGLIRTGHVVRTLRERVSTDRLDELGRALGYWAARWQPLPGQAPPAGTTAAATALDLVPAMHVDGGARTRIAHLNDVADWTPAPADFAR
ncbi:hypothetical protein BH24ACT5_BH24ACT5_02590 [soil metagenome]